MECSVSYVESYRRINQGLWNEHERGEIKLDYLRIERFRRLFSEYGIDINASRFSDRYVQYLGEGSFLIDGAVELCHDLQKKGYRLAIITNGIKEVQIGRISRSELTNMFEHIVVSEDTGFQKPHQGFFDYTFNKLSYQDKKKVLIVGDSLSSDIQGGINYGVDTCWFNPKKLINNSDFRPTYEIAELREVIRILEGS
ncbi:putative HAD-hydrolase YfnB [compost metagenome]